MTEDTRAQRLYVLNKFADPRGNGSVTVAKVDDTGRVVSAFPLDTDPPYPTAQTPLALVIDPRTRRLYILYDHVSGSDSHSPGAVWIVDADSGHIRHIVTVGHMPSALLVDTRTEHVFVANQGDNTASVLDVSHV